MTGNSSQVLVACDSDAISNEIARVLREAGQTLTVVSDGLAALHQLLHDHPAVLVVDVALSGRAPFELCDDIAQAGLRTRVLLVASVYNKTRYKRRPTSLYGADDYVEQHHIHDMLPLKVQKLLEGARGRVPVEHRDTPRDEAERQVVERVRDAAEERLVIDYASEEEGRQRAARLAELIVADMALYNGDALEALAVAAIGAPLPDRLESDLEEARRMFARMVPAEIRGEGDWIGRAFAELLARRRKRPISSSATKVAR